MAEEAIEKSIAMTELMDGCEQSLVFLPEHARGQVRASAVHFDHVVPVAVRHIEDEIADNERCGNCSGTRVWADAVEFPYLGTIRDAEGFQLAIGGDDDAAIAGEVCDG